MDAARTWRLDRDRATHRRASRVADRGARGRARRAGQRRRTSRCPDPEAERGDVRLTLFLLLATACHNPSKTDALTSSDAPLPAAPTPSAAAPAGSAAATDRWFVGAWQGVFRAELFRVEVPLG